MKQIELYNDHFQNWKRYLNCKAQLIIADPPYCYDPETEIWTTQGWKRYNELDLDDIVLSLDSNTLEMSYSGIDRIIINPAPQKMLQFKSHNIDLCVTNEHRMFCVAETRRKTTKGQRNRPSKYINNIRLANEISSNCRHPYFGFTWKSQSEVKEIVINGCQDETNGRECYIPPVKIPLSLWLPFFGLWLADGYSRKDKYTVGVKQAGDNRCVVRHIMEALPFKVHEYEERGTDKTNFEIHSKQLAIYLRQFGKAKDKFIPRWILDLPTEYLSLLFKWYCFGDSTRNGDGIKVSSVSRQLVDALQEITLKCGELCQINEYNYSTWKNELYSFQTQKRKRNFSFGKKSEIKPKCSAVWCITLKRNSVFLVRRNNKIAFCGNCIGKNAYASNPSWYVGGDNKNGESDKAGREFFDTDKNFRPAEFMHFCSQMLIKEPKETGKAPCMIIFCGFEQQFYYIELGKKYGFEHYINLVFRKDYSAQVLKANMRVVGNCEYGLILYKDKLPKFNNNGQMIFNCFDWIRDNKTPKVHPTQKPVPLLERLIEIFTDKGDVVIDPCAGSGTTLLACANTGRRGYGFEIKKDFYKAATEKVLCVAQPTLF